MRSTLANLLDRLDGPELPEKNVIPWGCPVPSFGDISQSRVATVGLNPSNREFVDALGNELDGDDRRFHTLNSLGLERWSDASSKQLSMIEEWCRTYFARNPYDTWFRALDDIISGTEFSYYLPHAPACHLDLIPFATSCKWTELTVHQRSALLTDAADSLGVLLRDSPVQILVLNGKSVVENVERIARTKFNKIEKRNWMLARRNGLGVRGYAYSGTVSEIAGIQIGREIRVLGFNHNIQSSFGVTQRVRTAIRNWVSNSTGAIGW